MKKIFKNKVFIFTLISVLFFVVGVKAATMYYSNEISYTPSDTSWNVTNVEQALNDLYKKNSNIPTGDSSLVIAAGNVWDESGLGSFSLNSTHPFKKMKITSITNQKWLHTTANSVKIGTTEYKIQDIVGQELDIEGKNFSIDVVMYSTTNTYQVTSVNVTLSL